MSPPVHDRIRRVRYSLAAIVVLQGLFYAGAAFFGALSLAALIRWKLLPRSQWGVALQYVPILVAIVTLAAFVWRGRFAWSFGRVALWIEERIPQLRYALVTLADPDCATTSVRDSLDQQVARADLPGVVQRASTLSVLLAVLAFAAMACIFAAIPPQYRSAETQSLPQPAAVGGGRSAAEGENPLSSIRATVTPPSYAKMPVQQLTDPLSIAGLVGTQVVVMGRGSREDITVQLGEQTLKVASGDGQWTSRFVLANAAAILKLVHRQHSRTVVIDPRPDLAPVVKLTLPEQDMTLRKPAGSLTLQARITDDIGVAHAHFEYIVSSGEGEGNITTRMGELASRAFEGAKSGDLAITVPFSKFELKEGDILSVSAVAFDANDVTGPGKGRSETRSIRIPRQNGHDEVAITPAPLTFDKTAMSLRMIVIAAEKLHEQRSTLPREKFVEKATALGRQGEVIRQKLKAIIDEQSGGGEFPVDPLLNEAMSHMWDGVRALNVAEPGEALPPLRSALEILRRLSNAQKYYIRGRVAPAVVDIDAVRMMGKENVDATARQPRAVADDIQEKLEAQFTQAVALLRSDSPRALEMFMAMRVSALQDAVAVAQPLQEVIEAIHTGRDTTQPLLKARQAIEGASRRADALPVWSNAW